MHGRIRSSAASGGAPAANARSRSRSLSTRFVCRTRAITAWRGRPGIAIGPEACTWLQIRRPTLSASAMMRSSIVSTFRSRMTNWPSTITDSMSDGWPL